MNDGRMTKQPPKVCMYSHCKGRLVDLGYTGSDGNDVFRCVECGAKQCIKGHRNWMATV